MDVAAQAKILLAGTTVGTNIYTPEFSVLWYIVNENFEIGQEYYDVIDLLDEKSRGVWEYFLEYDSEMVDWELFGHGGENMDLCLTEGYLPGDMIAVVVTQPSYSNYEGETDIHIDTDVISVVSGKIGLRQLEKNINAIYILDGEIKRKRAAKLAKAQADTDKMYLVQDSYFAPDQSLYCDMEMPRAVCITLRSHHMYPAYYLASGSSDSGSYSEARVQILKQIEQKLPHVAPLYEKLPHRAW